MPIKVVPNSWSSTVAYSVGTIVQYNGVRFSCRVAVPANQNGNTDPITDISNNSSPSWEFEGVIRIIDYYSLQYSIQEALNTDDDVIINSIPAFVQQTERLVGKVLRSPAQRIKRIFTLDADSKFEIPGDMLEVFHIRVNNDNRGGDIRSRGSVVIEKSADRTSFEELRLSYTNSTTAYTNYYPADRTNEFPLWYFDNRYIYVAPDFTEGTEIEMQYYQQVPDLGTTRLRVNDRYEAINAAGMTLAEWIAAGNSADTFVQAETTIISNLWTQTQPHVLKSGALVEACRFLKDFERSQVWEQQFNGQLQLAQNEFQQFKTSGAVNLQQQTAY